MVTTISESDICNMSLDLLLQENEEQVVDIVEPSTETEEICARWYDVTRRALLRKRVWNFAKTRVILTAASGDTPPFGFTTKHNLPNDWLRKVWLSDSSDRDSAELPTTDYTIEGSTTGQLQVLSDITGNLYAVYIRDFKETEFFEPLFLVNLVADLAANMAYKITGSNVNRKELYDLATEMLGGASAVDTAEEPPKRVERSNVRNLRRRKLYQGDNTIWNGS